MLQDIFFLPRNNYLSRPPEQHVGFVWLLIPFLNKHLSICPLAHKYNAGSIQQTKNIHIHVAPLKGLCGISQLLCFRQNRGLYFRKGSLSSRCKRNPSRLSRRLWNRCYLQSFLQPVCRQDRFIDIWFFLQSGHFDKFFRKRRRCSIHKSKTRQNVLSSLFCTCFDIQFIANTDNSLWISDDRHFFVQEFFTFCSVSQDFIRETCCKDTNGVDLTIRHMNQAPVRTRIPSTCIYRAA